MATAVPNLSKLARSDDGVKVQKLSHLVADRLRQRIVSGELAPGVSLPAENELLENYKVSRPTLREALRILESEALIEISRGSRTGPTVLGPSIERVAHYASQLLVSRGTTLADVHAARGFLEPAVVRSLATKPQKATIEQLKAAHARQVEALEAGRFDDVVSEINTFHELLVELSGNQSLMLIVGILHEISALVYAKVLSKDASDRSVGRTVENMRKSIAGYSKLVQLISEGKAEEAESFWRIYMERSLNFMVRTGIGSSRVTLEAV